MAWYWTLSIGLIVIVFLKYITNRFKHQRLEKYHSAYVDGYREKSSAIVQHKSQIIELFKEAGVDNFVVHRLEPAGYGQLRQYQIDGFQNIALQDDEVFLHMCRTFAQAKGVFQHRMEQAINPMFWIDFIVKLPTHLASYLNIAPEKTAVKLINIAYWIGISLLGLKKANFLEWLTK